MKVENFGIAHIERRHDVDGLRAVAVLGVVIYHAFPSLVPGGFVGVDVFFVISGFIISSIIFKSLERGRFSFAAFYARRIRRIFPPLLLVMAACLAFGWFALFSDEYAQLGKHVAAGAAFLSNIALWTEAGYFDNAAETKPLLHLWSLGIEEQFYLVFPATVWLAWKLRANLAVIVAGTCAASLVVDIVSVQQDAVGAFYSPLMRFWELLVGSLLAWFTLHGRLGREVANPSAMSLVGIALLALAFTVIRPEGFPGAWAILPVAGAGLLIAAGPAALVNRWVLSHPVALWFGWISFSLYLWHWPLLSFGRIMGAGPLTILETLLLVAPAIVLAWLSTWLLETPIRKGEHGGLKAAAASAAMVVVAASGFGIFASGGLSDRSMAQIGAAATEARRDWTYETTRLENEQIVGLHFLAGQQSKTVLFIGSSIMGQYFPRADLIYSQDPKPRLSAIYASRNHCTPIPGYTLVTAPENVSCEVYYAAAMKLAWAPEVTRVVLSADWPPFFANGKISQEGQEFASDLTALVAAGKSVFLIGRPPMDKRFDPTAIARLRTNWSVSREEAEDEASMADLGRIADLTGAVLINPLDYLCSDTCPVIVNGRPNYNDASHIRAEYAASSATFIDEIVQR